MPKTIWKFPIALDTHIALHPPEGAEVLSVQVQNDQPCVWVLVDDSRPLALLRLRVYGTGHPVHDDPLEFIDTIQLHGGALVFHVFRVVEV